VRTPDTFVKGLGVFLPETQSVESAVERGLFPAEEVEPDGLVAAAVAGEIPAPEMALRAARQAYERCGHDPAATDLMLYSTTWMHGPEGWLPPSYLQDRLIGGDVLSLELRQGCSGMFGALELGASYLKADPARGHALLVASDNYGTPLMDRWRTGPFLGGDAATALLLSTRDGFAEVLSVGTRSVPDATADLNIVGEPLFPPALTTGVKVDFRARGLAIASDPKLRALVSARGIQVHRKMIEVVQTTLDEAGIGISDVTRMGVVNVARGLIESRGMTQVGLDLSKSTWDYGRTIGHCGSSDQLLGLEHLLRTGQLGAGDHYLMLGTGPSITVSCAVLKILEVPSWAA
jgi:3-oxoacyl-[acyl-carrier-protein] synthase-3